MPTVKIKQVTGFLEEFAPLAYQESYDNAGLIYGDSEAEVKGILVSIDCTETLIDEALKKKCNLIVTHHPLIFKGVKSLTGKSYVERAIIKAIKNNIGVYAAHTNLDNIGTGVNKKISEKIGLKNCRILDPKKGLLSKLVTFIPKENTEEVIQALHKAGAGNIGNYNQCSFRIEGTGTFMPNEFANPLIGKKHVLEKVNEVRVEMIFPNHIEKAVLAALKTNHPYDEIAYYLTSLSNEFQDVGSGMIGELDAPVSTLDFLESLKKTFNSGVVRFTKVVSKKIKKVALCGGAGSFLLSRAIAENADIFISADFKYHEFFDAENKIIIADIGHYESEQFTKELLVEQLTEKFPNFAVNFSKTDTNPISHL